MYVHGKQPLYVALTLAAYSLSFSESPLAVFYVKEKKFMYSFLSNKEIPVPGYQFKIIG